MVLWREILRYVFALVCVAAALVLTEVLGVWAQPDFSTFYVLAVLIVALVAGLRAALFATMLSTTAIAYAQVGWTVSVDIGWDDALRAAVFAVVAIIVSSLAARQREA